MRQRLGDIIRLAGLCYRDPKRAYVYGDRARRIAESIPPQYQYLADSVRRAFVCAQMRLWEEGRLEPPPGYRSPRLPR